MKKLLSFAVVFLLVVSLSGCGNAGQQADRSESMANPSVQSVAEEDGADNAADAPADESDLVSTDEVQESMERTDILIAYFSRADENYGVGVIEKGNTEIIAEMVADKVGGELFHIERAVPYPAVYDECRMTAGTCKSVELEECGYRVVNFLNFFRYGVEIWQKKGYHGFTGRH